MSDLKTKVSDKSVEDFLNTVPNEKKREDSFRILNIMKEVTGEEPKMWGDSIVGFGEYHYQYSSGRSGNWFKTGFSPRKQNISLYIMSGFDGAGSFLARLGKHKTSKACLYINKLADIDEGVLRELIVESVRQCEVNWNK